jgi:hypothetical protein
MMPGLFYQKQSARPCMKMNKAPYWIGTQEGFANVIFSEKENKISGIKWYYNNSNSRNSLNYNHVSCFLDDPTEPAKYLWICTKGGGLNRLNKNTGDFVHLTPKKDYRTMWCTAYLQMMPVIFGAAPTMEFFVYLLITTGDSSRVGLPQFQ